MNDSDVELRKLAIINSKCSKDMNVLNWTRDILISMVESKIYRFEKMFSIISYSDDTKNGSGKARITTSFSPEILKSLLEDCTEEEKMLLKEVIESVERRDIYNHSKFDHDIAAAESVIASLDSDEDIEKYMEPYAEEFGASTITKFLTALKDDNLRQKLFKEYREKFNKQHRYNSGTYLDEVLYRLALSFESDECILEILEKINEPRRKEFTIALLSSDEKKLELMENPKFRGSGIIVASLSSDDKKLELWNSGISLTDEDEVLISLGSDDKKLEQLEARPNLKNKGRVIASLSSNKKKAELLPTLDIKGQIEVALSMDSDEKTDEIIIDLLTKVSGKEYKKERADWAEEYYSHSDEGRLSTFSHTYWKKEFIRQKQYEDKNYSEDDYDKLLIDYIQAKLVSVLSTDELKEQVIADNPDTLGRSAFMGLMVASYDSDDKKLKYLEQNPLDSGIEKDLLVGGRQQHIVIKSLSKDKEKSKEESIVQQLKHTLERLGIPTLNEKTEGRTLADQKNELEALTAVEAEAKALYETYCSQVGYDDNTKSTEEL